MCDELQGKSIEELAATLPSDVLFKILQDQLAKMPPDQRAQLLKEIAIQVAQNQQVTEAQLQAHAAAEKQSLSAVVHGGQPEADTGIEQEIVDNATLYFREGKVLSSSASNFTGFDYDDIQILKPKIFPPLEPKETKYIVGNQIHPNWWPEYNEYTQRPRLIIRDQVVYRNGKRYGMVVFAYQDRQRISHPRDDQRAPGDITFVVGFPPGYGHQLRDKIRNNEIPAVTFLKLYNRQYPNQERHQQFASDGSNITVLTDMRNLAEFQEHAPPKINPK